MSSQKIQIRSQRIHSGNGVLALHGGTISKKPVSGGTGTWVCGGGASGSREEAGTTGALLLSLDPGSGSWREPKVETLLGLEGEDGSGKLNQTEQRLLGEGQPEMLLLKHALICKNVITLAGMVNELMVTGHCYTFRCDSSYWCGHCIGHCWSCHCPIDVLVLAPYALSV